MMRQTADDTESGYPEPEPQIGAVITFTPVPVDDRPLPREFAIGYHGSDRVDTATRRTSKAKA